VKASDGFLPPLFHREQWSTDGLEWPLPSLKLHPECTRPAAAEGCTLGEGVARYAGMRLRLTVLLLLAETPGALGVGSFISD
jgi:hypothetical protein